MRGVEPTTVQRALVAGRLLGVATTTLALTVGGHALADGALPDGGLVLVLGVLTLAASGLLARAPLRARSLLPFAAGAQLALHAALTWLGPGSAGGALPQASAAPHAGHPAESLGLLGRDALTSSGGGDLHLPMAPMLVAHVAAGLLTVALLLGTERAVLAAVRRWSRLLPDLLSGRPRPVASRLRAPSPRTSVDPVATYGLGTGGTGRRGPPAWARPCVPVH